MWLGNRECPSSATLSAESPQPCPGARVKRPHPHARLSPYRFEIHRMAGERAPDEIFYGQLFSLVDSCSKGVHMEVARSGRLLLRHLEEADRSEIIAMHEAANGSGQAISSPVPGNDYDQLVDRWLGDDPTRHVRLVAEHLHVDPDCRIVALINLTDLIRGVFQNAFIGWRTHPAVWNRGFGTEAVRLALQYAFAADGLNLHRDQADILPENRASCRVAEKAGFRLEGVAQHYLYIRDRWRDHLMYAITAETFSGTYAAPDYRGLPV